MNAISAINNIYKMSQLLGFMFGWLTFYHQGHEVAKDFKPYMTELQLKIQKVGIINLFHLFNCSLVFEQY